MDDIPPLPDWASELEGELAFGAFNYCPEEGIRHMTTRIAGLEREIADALANESTGADLEYIQALRSRLVPQLRSARQRLAEYQLLLNSGN
jgi:hypothetical protein